MHYSETALNHPCLSLNANVSCLYPFQANPIVTKTCVALSNLRNTYVALSILRVEGHDILT